MLLLSADEREQWRSYAAEALAGGKSPGELQVNVRVNLAPILDFYLGAFLAASGLVELGRRWLVAGALNEEEALMSNSYLSSFLDRHGGALAMPAVVFADPAPYIHFTGVPTMRDSRRRFLAHCANSLPRFNAPVRIVDIGCGDGALTAALVESLRAAGKVGDVKELALIDRSPAMLAVAERTVGKVLDKSVLKLMPGKIEDLAGRLEGRYDIAVSALAYHHMPLEQKRVNLGMLRPRMDHFIVFDIDANNDLPEQFSPELALSVYQSYGRMINLVFMHDAPVDLALSCVDAFLMTEEVSFLIEPRGRRNDYHMLKTQWHDLFAETLAPDFNCLCDTSCYADDYTGLFTLHYGR